ncbi:DUF4241 domain-containing protein [Streptomyces sp. FH025]|uniref:DUF4241 domain-containing protein n=1 Tax=Streptomyces sp. FH025 TaxID=2815937 RepID=UPI001A9F8BDB|nr:DUF4241 domain-containing protein [Streptomyces sp. FH025]MBO1414211.1 DUF4241 domain-containing protein [Streptomyces sp. FH025]
MTYTVDARLAANENERRLLEAVFTPGEGLGIRAHDPLTVVRVAEVTEVTTIRVPSGRLVVGSPWPEDDDYELNPPVGRELAERIPPGSYRVEASWFFESYDHGDYPSVAAVRLCVTQAPVVAWENALGVGEDVESARPGARFGFDYPDTNMACFADATAWIELTLPFRQFWRDRRAGLNRARASEDLCDGSFERVRHEGLGADLVTFVADEDNLVWLGRAADGAVASVVVVGGFRPHPY